MEASVIPVRFAAAVEHQRAGRLAEAEALYQTILEAEPGHAGSHHMLGGLALQRGQPEAAAAAIERAIAIDGKNAVFHTTLGQAQLQLGEPERALASFRAAAAAQPDFYPAHFLAGLALRESGRLDEARTAFETAIRINPQFVQALFNLAAILQEQGEPAAAIPRYREALAAAPDLAGAHLNLGICLAAGEEFAAALPHLERAAALEPALVEAHSALGNVLLKLDQGERAIAAYRKGLEIAPKAAVLHYNMGNAFRDLERLEAALISYREALAADPSLVQAMINAGSACENLGRHAEAEQHYRRAVAADPRTVLGHTGLSLALHSQGAVEEAMAEAERAIALDASLPDGHSALGVCLQELGRFEEAAAAFRRSLACDPHFPSALVHLANLRGVETSEAGRARLKETLASRRLTSGDRVSLHLALGRLADESGDYDAAFADYERGNAIRAAQQGYDHATMVRHVEALMRVFDRDLFASHAALGAASERPILVLGMPRSGTTLIEQILASQPLVHGSGELAASGLLIDGLASLPAARAAGKAYPEAVRLIDRGSAELLAGRYLEAIGRGAGDAKHVTDKLPFNFLRVGILAFLLPRARIIHATRDPFDTCLSCYFQDFQDPQPFVYELDRLGKYYRQYERLMAHWRSVLPHPMLEVPNEALVGDPEPWCRRILAHCGLAWDERVLRFFATERTVQTASYWQVRQPIYASSVGRWRHYRKHLGPLFAALGRTPADDDAAR
ncbi:MAG: tetratricopeptide repeat protein [Alphaproteobacteria bacterium]